MKIEAVSEGHEALLYMERYVNEGTRTYSPFAARSEVAPQYQPRSGTPSFDLFGICVPRYRVSIFEADPSQRLLEHYIRPEHVLFMVHPEVWDLPGIEHLDELKACPHAGRVAVAPTASTRTVFTCTSGGDVPPHFIKLHLPRRISRFNRRLRRKNIENSIAISRDLAHVDMARFAYLPEALGMAIGDDKEGWGFVIRETSPRPFHAKKALVPCFALYGGDLNHPGDPPLIVQMIERSGLQPEAFLVDHILIPVVECWVEVARNWGVLLESHGQNTLLELDENFLPERVVHRDFDAWVDLDTRQRRGLAVPFAGAGVGGSSDYPAPPRYSLVYDRFIGHEFFDYVLKTLRPFYQIHEEAVRSRVRDAFHQAFPDADRFFPPRTMFYFSNEPQPGGDFKLVDMNQTPVWR
ncbi:MAG TPA: IucA/IucC family C-terminal-domain containing protein [Pedomonas sp.]|uniref:IucA/IucC family C-terminal-domain containing protein n=1 Tax=Pedomonas sp. TaxID=2976421 RepID=UPI002F3EEDC7